MRGLGHLCLWCGFLGAAFCSVLRLEQSSDKWSTIPWNWYLLAMGIGVAGVVLLRRARQQEHTDLAQTEAQFSIVRQSLQQVADAVSRLSEQTELMPSQVMRQIDDQCAQPLSDFADARSALVRRFGLEVYAEVMTQFAAAERYINRSWSAAADGYVDEVRASLKRASAYLDKARQLVRDAELAEPMAATPLERSATEDNS
jgi:hypothetical protein